jgi:hypothetical protein
MRIRLAVIAIAAACQPRSTTFDYLTPPAGADGRVGLGALDRELASSLRTSYEQRVDEAPIALVPTDGSQLGLAALDATVTIEGPLAHTELHFKFTNTEARIREGRFSIALPAGAAVDRFAMKIGQTWRESRIVSRAQGRQVYETYLHHKLDPALLEQDLGNRFSARVFPIAASADKEIIIGYDHAVSAERPYVLALHGLPAIPSLRVTIDHDGNHRQLANNRALPEDVVEAIDARTIALSSGDSFVARLAPAVAAAADPLEHVLILVDTSASRAPLMAKQVGLVHAIAAAVHGDVTIAAFDHGIDEVYRGPASAATPDKLLDHGALGASDLGKALGYAASTGMTRIVLVGDGTPTLGESDPGKLAAIVSAVGRIDAVQVGDNVDADVLRAVVAAGRHPGALLDGRDAMRAIAQLQLAIPAEQPIVVDGASETWPATTRGIAPNEPIWVFGHRSGDGNLAIRVGDVSVSLVPHPGTASRIRRAVAGTEIAALTQQLTDAKDADARTKLGADIENIALANNLVSARTSLLVLESDDDEARMLGPKPAGNIDPPAVDAAGVSFSGATSLENQYIVDGVDATGKGESSSQRGEVIEIAGDVPSIDQSSAHMGVTLTNDYTSNIPVARTFSGTVGAAAGTQADTFGVPTPERYTVEDRPNGAYAGGRMAHPMPTLLPGSATSRGAEADPTPPPPVEPYVGPMKQVMTEIAAHRPDKAVVTATHWELSDPGDIAAIVALGEALEARGATALAARAYGSILDLYPNRSELLRAAGERLDRVSGGRSLAIDAYRRAVHERPDQASTYRLLAYALYRDGQAAEALSVLDDGIKRAQRPSIAQIFREDRQLIEAAMNPKAHPTKPSLRMILSWETDANDVDLHVYDNAGGHAFFSDRELKSGGALRDDITTGFGPEMFEVDQPKAFPYRIGINYYSRGPMGVGIGTVQVIRFDGTTLSIEDRPFILQTDNATVDLGVVTR